VKKIFFVTLSGSRGFPKWDFLENILISAGGLWWPNRGKFVRRKVPPYSGKFFLDSGGFSLLSRFGDYPFSVFEYYELVKHYQPNFAAIMDYPCEPDVNRDRFRDNKERILRTLDHTEQLLALDPGSHSEWVPVIQGFKLQEYRYCIDQMAKRELFRDYMAIGSMCRRIAVSEIRHYVRGIQQHLSEYCGLEHTRLHWFGLKAEALQDPTIREATFSCDSMAWQISPTGKKYPADPEVKKRMCQEYIRKVESRLCVRPHSDLMKFMPHFNGGELTP
jgi:hypothetical protein